jgi:hypothetical protein
MELSEVIAVAAVAGLPAFILALWAWFKARAAATSQLWDDHIVEVVQNLTKGVQEKR